MSDLSDHLSKAATDLEIQKEALRSRLESLETAINGIHDEAIAPHQISDELPLRETAAELIATRLPDPQIVSERRDFILKQDTPNYSSGARKALSRSLPIAPSDRRKEPSLNIYVNEQPEWAARQFVSPQSRRAIFRKKTGQRCPQCGSSDTRPSLTRGFTDRFMFLFDYSLARCRNCDTRFRIWRSREDHNDSQA